MNTYGVLTSMQKQSVPDNRYLFFFITAARLSLLVLAYSSRGGEEGVV